MTHQRSVVRNRRCIACRAAVLVVMVLAGFQSSVEADEAARKAYDAVKEGNQLLAEEKFVEALKAYDRAAALSPDSPQVAYNRGLALYRLGKFEAARKAFQDAIKPSHPEIEARAKYNLGRTAHAEAMEHASEPKQAIEDLSRAINFYQDALRLDPKQTDPDAQKNLSLAERLRAYFQKRLEQQQPPQPQPSSQPSSQPQDPQPQPTTSRSQTSQPASQPTSGKSESADEPEKNEQESQEGSEGQEQNQDGEQDDSESQKGSDQKESESQKQPSADRQDGSDQASGQQDETQKEQKSSANPEQKTDRDDRLREEEIQPMLQEARDAEKARREARRMKMMRQRGRTAVPKDW
ncbi:MAG: tetratricopeptide repeat protein [Planctomycetia bacterium]|nr:MAG: tetratricopeptide repeat protein [Planctomycetia bacterium]RIK70153.1 MAG: hypothetical protein DCC66_06380 [Planctomycetota bacterium]